MEKLEGILTKGFINRDVIFDHPLNEGRVREALAHEFAKNTYGIDIFLENSTISMETISKICLKKSKEDKTLKEVFYTFEKDKGNFLKLIFMLASKLIYDNVRRSISSEMGILFESEIIRGYKTFLRNKKFILSDLYRLAESFRTKETPYYDMLHRFFDNKEELYYLVCFFGSVGKQDERMWALQVKTEDVSIMVGKENISFDSYRAKKVLETFFTSNILFPDKERRKIVIQMLFPDYPKLGLPSRKVKPLIIVSDENKINEVFEKEILSPQIENCKYLDSLKRSYSHIPLIDGTKLPINDIIPISLSDETVDFKQLLSANYVILGESGVGKSTFFKYILYNASDFFNKGLTSKLPVLIDLGLNENVIQGTRQFLQIHGISANDNDIEALLVDNGFVFLIDEFDFVTNKTNCLKQIRNLLTLSHKSTAIITSRFEDTANYFGFSPLKIEKSTPAKIRSFLERCLEKKELNILMKYIEDENYGGILRNPLFLWATVLLIKKEPSGKIMNLVGVILKNILEDYLLGMWGKRKSSHFAPFSKEEIVIECLEIVAFEMINSGETDERRIREKIGKYLSDLKNNCEIFGLSASEVIEIACTSFILDKQKKPGTIHFSHDCYMEYFAAKKIKHEWESYKKIDDIYFLDKKWFGPVVIAGDLIEDVEDFVEYLLSKNIVLAAKCYIGERFYSETVRRKLVENLAKECSREVANLMRLLKKDVDADLFLELVNSPNENDRFCAVLCLEGIYREDVVKALLKALDDDSFSVRVNGVAILGRMKIQEAVEPLAKILQCGGMPSMLYGVVIALCNIGSKEVIEPLMEFVLNYEGASEENHLPSRKKAIIALQKIIPDRIEDIFIQKCSSKNWFWRCRAIESLYNMKSTKCIEQYEKMLKDPDRWVRYFALHAIGDVAADNNISESVTQQAIAILLKVYGNKEYSSNINGLEVIGCLNGIKDDKIKNFFEKILSDPPEDPFIIIEAFSSITKTFSESEISNIFHNAIKNLKNKEANKKDKLFLTKSQTLRQIYKQFLSGNPISLHGGQGYTKKRGLGKCHSRFQIRDSDETVIIVNYPSGKTFKVNYPRLLEERMKKFAMAPEIEKLISDPGYLKYLHSRFFEDPYIEQIMNREKIYGK